LLQLQARSILGAIVAPTTPSNGACGGL